MAGLIKPALLFYSQMKYFITLTILPFLLVFLTPPSDDVPQRLLVGLKQWNEQHPQEKVFIHTDRDQYVAGETIWFKAWCTVDSKPSFLSKILYVDLVDESGSVVEKKMYQLNDNSSTAGVIDLIKDIKSGNYSLNAYTLWMLNYPNYVFKKNLFIYNTDYNKKTTIKSQPSYTLSFFPEGGDMVENIKGRVAFKAVDNFGYPANVKGSILTNTGSKVLDFNSEHDGMGYFELQPSSNTSYIAKAEINGKLFDYKLPIVKKEGVTLQIQNSSATRLFILLGTNEINKEKYSKLFLIAHVNGLPVYKADFKPNEGETGASISKRGLPAGIIHITLFDSIGTPLAERLAFIANHKVISPEVKVKKLGSGKRGINLYNFRFDSLVFPDISVLITDASIHNKKNIADNIASSFLLTSDIKGYIHNPGYYFATSEEKTLQHLDLLLMTQGWRRFNWNQIKGEEKITLAYTVETFMNVRGKVNKTDRKETITNGTVSFIIKAEDSTTILSTATITDKGEFIVDSINFTKAATVSYEGNNNKNKLPVDVIIYPSYIDSLKKSSNLSSVNMDTSSIDVNSTLNGYIKSSFNALDLSDKEYLQNITVKTKKISRLDSLQKEYVSPIYENSDQSIDTDENSSYSSIWQIMNARINGFSVNPYTAGGVTSATFARNEGINIPNEEGAGTDRNIQFFLNEIPVSADVIDAIVPTDVALIKVYKGPLASPFGADGGAIAVYTKKGIGPGKIHEKRFEKHKKRGFDFTREFYSPDYTANPELNKDKEDNRITLYWNPKMKQEKDGSYTIQFHNNDIANKFKLVIQGIDKKGNLIYREQIIQ